MKKIFSILFCVFCAVTAGAKTTYYFNARIGGGLASGFDAPKKLNGAILGPDPGATVMFQPNICVGSKKQFVLAPTLQYEVSGFTTDLHMDHVISVPLLFGYRVRMGNGIFFVPKIGPTLGYLISSSGKDYLGFGGIIPPGYVEEWTSSYSDNLGSGVMAVFREKNSFIIGPYLDLAFEIKRFVIGLSGYYSITSQEMGVEKYVYDNAGIYGYFTSYTLIGGLSSNEENSSLSAFHHYGMYLTFGVKF